LNVHLFISSSIDSYFNFSTLVLSVSLVYESSFKYSLLDLFPALLLAIDIDFLSRAGLNVLIDSEE